MVKHGGSGVSSAATESDVFDPFLHMVQSSDHFDEEDIACVEETRREHQKHVQTRIQMDQALRDTQRLLAGRMETIQEFERNVPVHTKASPAYKHFFETFAQKQISIQEKYQQLLERRESIYGKYTAEDEGDDINGVNDLGKNLHYQKGAAVCTENMDLSSDSEEDEEGTCGANGEEQEEADTLNGSSSNKNMFSLLDPFELSSSSSPPRSTNSKGVHVPNGSSSE